MGEGGDRSNRSGEANWAVIDAGVAPHRAIHYCFGSVKRSSNKIDAGSEIMLKDIQEINMAHSGKRTPFSRPLVCSGQQRVSALKELVEQYKKELTYRDGGASARATYQVIKGISTNKELVTILEENGPPPRG